MTWTRNVSTTTAIAFALLVGCVVFLGNQRPAHAVSGREIVCFVFTDLNNIGSPLPVLDASECAATSTPSGGGTLKVIKLVSGTSTPSASFDIHVKLGLSEVGGSPQAGSESGVSFIGLAPSAYLVSETSNTDGIDMSDFTVTFDGCSAGVAVVSSGRTTTCTITNTYNAAPPTPTPSEDTLESCSDEDDNDGDGLVDLEDPDCASFIPTPPSGGLVVEKQVSGGTASPGDFSIHVKSGDIDTVGSPQPGTSSGTSYTLGAGSYTVSEDGGPLDYTPAFTGDCSGSGVVAVSAGATSTCTIVNTFTGSMPTGGGNEQPTAPQSDGGGGRRGGGSGSCRTGFAYNPTTRKCEPRGQVLGATTSPATVATSTPLSCTALISTHMRRGRANDPAQVKLLQQFLNRDPDTQVARSGPGSPGNETGFFGPLTDAAVKKFQLKYSAEVLAPWVPFGLASDKTPTGYVYKTTLRKINLIHCASFFIALPKLP